MKRDPVPTTDDYLNGRGVGYYQRATWFCMDCRRTYVSEAFCIQHSARLGHRTTSREAARRYRRRYALRTQVVGRNLYYSGPPNFPRWHDVA